jgi:hypothetical protein
VAEGRLFFTFILLNYFLLSFPMLSFLLLR